MANQDLYTQIILEELKHEIKIIAEGHLLLKEKLDNVMERIDETENRLDRAGIPKKIA